MREVNFHNAIEETGLENNKDRILLLGNGFSISYGDSKLAYANLFEKAKQLSLFEGDQFIRAKQLLEEVCSCDFELAMEKIEQALKVYEVLGIYGLYGVKIQQMKNDATELKNVLIQVIQKTHPEQLNEDDKYSSCANFLKKFKEIYTLNYDLLLYWVIAKHLTSIFFDGFGFFNEPIWPSNNISKQNIFYLHGGLAFFNFSSYIKKLTNSVCGNILTKFDESILRGDIPIIVTGGNAQEKLKHIFSNNYLNYCYSKLKNHSDANNLFIFGFAFKDCDRHIIEAIQHRKFQRIYISYFENNEAWKNKVNDKLGNNESQVCFFKAEDACIWSNLND
ncbi:MAG: DUF4917 family protein [Deltaproteobacteria bacterium]|nr:DUF4917 family protein [Deltaproteobacteria bacterium]